MEKITAMRFLSLIDEATGKLSEAADVAHSMADESERERLLKGLGDVLNEILDKIFEPIFELHPDLRSAFRKA